MCCQCLLFSLTLSFVFFHDYSNFTNQTELHTQFYRWWYTLWWICCKVCLDCPDFSLPVCSVQLSGTDVGHIIQAPCVYLGIHFTTFVICREHVDPLLLLGYLHLKPAGGNSCYGGRLHKWVIWCTSAPSSGVVGVPYTHRNSNTKAWVWEVMQLQDSLSSL